MKRAISIGVLVCLSCFATVGWGQWNPHTVLELNGEPGAIKLPGKFQIVTEKMSRVVTVPYIVYMPEKDRLLMVVSCDYPNHAAVLFSKDHGATWSEPKFVHLDAAGAPEVFEAHSLTYLGGGKVLLDAGKKLDAPRAGKDGRKRMSAAPYIWYSTDYGETWGNPTLTSVGDLGGDPFWDPFLVDRDPKTGKVDRVLASGNLGGSPAIGLTMKAGYSDAGLMASKDGGHTWSNYSRVPQWTGVSEVAFVRAANGNLVAACRTDWLDRFRKQDVDHYEGLAISISKDNGKTWSQLNRLYAWGRHHPSMVLLPNGDIVMTYVVRKGYPHTVDGIPQFGVEAIVSHDNGETWDLDHRYILARWPGLTKGPGAWMASPQATSTVLMPDGSLLTTFGTGYRSLDSSHKIHPAPRDVGLVSWKVSNEPVNSERRITDASWDSDPRNEYNPDPERHEVRSECAAAPGKKIISVAEEGVIIETSPSDGRPEYLLHNPYNQPVLTLESMPAWIEMKWPEAHRIDEIHILPGAPEWVLRPTTEEVPLDYRLQYEEGSTWRDLVPPVTNAERYSDFNKTKDPYDPYIFTDEEFEYIHKFPAVETKLIRMLISRSNDAGIREAGGKVVVPEDKRETALRSVEVFEANSGAADNACREAPPRAVEISEPK